MKFSGLADVQSLAAERDGLTVYNAGLPRFPRNFTRDGIITALISGDMDLLRDQLLFCAKHQGVKPDPLTGEELGKIHHEWPGYPLRDYFSTYNACDAAGFFLIGLQFYLAHTQDDALLAKLSDAALAAADYIVRHVDKDGLFIESPEFCGATQFALKVTYWKDSVIMGRANGEPVYPAVFTLAHCQNLCALRMAASFLKTTAFSETITAMEQALETLWDANNNTFYAAIDAQGPISANTSDALHALYYLAVDDLTTAQVAHIVQTAEDLETSIGYRVASPETAANMGRGYHASTVWPFEQALIHAGAAKFGLARVQRVCERIRRTDYLGSPEAVGVTIEEFEISSNPQLWTLAAQRYFGSI